MPLKCHVTHTFNCRAEPPVVNIDHIRRRASHPEMEFGKLVPVPQYTTACGKGYGLAACPSLGLLVTSDFISNTLSVWSLPSTGGGSSAGSGAGGGANGLARVCTLGGDGSPAPMRFKFSNWYGSGYLAFTSSSLDSSTLLFVTDAGHDAVQIVPYVRINTAMAVNKIYSQTPWFPAEHDTHQCKKGWRCLCVHTVDVVSRAHVGYVAAPGSIAGPRGVAARENLVAVSAWIRLDSGDHVVHLYQRGTGGGALWVHVRVIGGGFGHSDGQLKRHNGLRFSADGTAICVADHWNRRVSMFRVGDGGFVRHIATELGGPLDVEEVDGGWAVACQIFLQHVVEFASDGGSGRPFLGKAGGERGDGDGEFNGPAALALVPGFGLIVREWGNSGRLQVFSTPDIVAMWGMSDVRVGWITATYRAVVHRFCTVPTER